MRSVACGVTMDSMPDVTLLVTSSLMMSCPILALLIFQILYHIYNTKISYKHLEINYESWHDDMTSKVTSTTVSHITRWWQSRSVIFAMLSYKYIYRCQEDTATFFPRYNCRAMKKVHFEKIVILSVNFNDFYLQWRIIGFQGIFSNFVSHL